MTIHPSEKTPSPLRLLGALAGDSIGSVYEFHPLKSTHFELFSARSRLTDDSILTLAVAQAILNGRGYRDCIQEYARRYPGRGYGGYFAKWIHQEDSQPYNSFGNGSAMRVSPVGWAFDSEADVLREAAASAAVTHDHPQGIKGAQAVALAILRARQGAGKEAIRAEITQRFGYDLTQTLDGIRPTYAFDETCQGSVPQAMLAFLESDDFEDAVRKAISLGGDADTQAAISGSIAEAFYGGVPEEIVVEVKKRTPEELWAVVEEFSQRVAGQAN
jgi:ADP-ribosylglycohydrolase